MEHTAQESEKQVWTQTAVGQWGRWWRKCKRGERASSQHQLMGAWLLLQQKQWLSKIQQVKRGPEETDQPELFLRFID